MLVNLLLHKILPYFVIAVSILIGGRVIQKCFTVFKRFTK